MRMIRRRVSRSSVAELSKSQSPHCHQLSNPIVQPQRGDTSLAPGERGEPLGEPSVTRGLCCECIGDERLGCHCRSHHSNRNISYGVHWFFEVVVD